MKNNNIPQEIHLETVRCPLGCPLDDEIYLKGFDRINNLPGIFTIVRCRNCDLLRTNPRPTQESIGYYYPKNYGPYINSNVASNRSHPDILKIKKWLINNILRTHTRTIPKIKPGKLLEIGCASGNYLSQMKEQGWDVEGIEFSPDAAANASARGLKVHTGAIEDILPSSQEYDLIVGWMVFEHLHQPISVFKKLRNWIKPEGWLVLSVPDISTPWHKISGNCAFDLHLPNHLFHFTPETLEKTLDFSGWTIKKVLHQKTSRSLIPTLKIMLNKKRSPEKLKIKSFFSQSVFNEMALYPLSFLLGTFKLSGRMTVWAKIKDVPFDI